MDGFSNSITLEQLLALNLDEVRNYLDTLQPPSIDNSDSLEKFYRETRGILLIIFLVDEFMIHPFLLNNFEAQTKLSNLKAILVEEHQSRLQFIASLTL